jgi:putative nucleotidyltransferase-like protein
MGRSLSPEFRLAAACAMWPPSDRRNEAVRTAAAGPIDWPRFLRVARRHQVIGLVHEGLTRARPDVPPGIAREIGAQSTALVRENLAMAREALRIQRLFGDADLPVLFVKGAALAVLAFGNLGLRAGQDIDLLVADETLPAATALVLHAGYRRFDPPPDISDAQLRLLMPLRKDLGFVDQATGLRIELHWRLFLNPHAMAEASIMAASRVVPLGTEGLRTLGEEDLFAYLCMHGALHWWNRLKWLADVNALLTSTPEYGIERLVQAAEARGVGRAAAQALLLCRRLLATPLPDRLMATLAKSATVRWLEATALGAMATGQGEREPREERFGTTRGSLSTFLLGRTWRYRLSEVRTHLTNQRDVLAVPLPEQLRFLYPFLRLPFWVWRHARRRL